MTWLSYFLGIFTGALFSLFILGLIYAAKDNRPTEYPMFTHETKSEWREEK